MKQTAVRVHQAFLSRLERCTVTPRRYPLLSHGCKDKVCFSMNGKIGVVGAMKRYDDEDASKCERENNS